MEDIVGSITTFFLIVSLAWLFVNISGYLCKQLLRFTKCKVCRGAIKNEDSYSQQPSVQLVNLKTHGRLIHLNSTFFNLVMALKMSFANNCRELDVYERNCR